MTVSSSTARVEYAEDGVSTVFPVPFRFLAASDLRVVRRSAAGVETVLVLNSGFTVTGGGDGPTGTLTTAAAGATGNTLRITRRTAREQPINYTAFDPFPAETQERGLDRAMLVAQDLEAGLALAVTVPEAEASAGPVVLPPIATRAGKFPVFDGAGKITTSSGTGNDPALRTDLASTGGAALVKAANGQTLQQFIDGGANGLSLKSAGATGNGSTDDTSTLQAVATAAPAGALVTAPPGEYLTNGLTFSKAVTLTGAENASLKAAANNVTLLYFPGDPTTTGGFPSPRDSAPGYRAIGLDINGNGADFYTVRAGVVGVKFGSTAYSQVQPVTRDLFIHGCEIGRWHYGSQEAEDLHSKMYRNRWGQLVQSDPNNGGATATILHMSTYQLNQVGAVYDNIGRFARSTTATLANSSTAMTAVGNLTGVQVGHRVEGRGIKPGTTVAALPGGGAVTLSQTTTAAAAMAKVPVRFFNDYGFGNGFGTGWIERGATFQNNNIAAIASWGFDLEFHDCHFEVNSPGSGTSSSSDSARVVPDIPITHSNSYARYVGGSFNENVSPMMNLIDGTRVELHGITPTGAITGDLTSSLALFGHMNNLGAQIFVPLVRWPDTFSLASASGWYAFGDATQQRSGQVPNQFSKINPRVPLMENPGAGVTVSTAIYPAMGACTKVQHSGTAGAYGVNSVDCEYFAGGIAIGDWLLTSFLVASDTFTTLHLFASSGGQHFGNADIPVGPYVQRVVILWPAQIADTNVRLNLWPAGTDAPAFYYGNMMQARAVEQDRAARTQLCAVLREGLFNDGTVDGSLTGEATIDLPSIASGAASAEQTITVRGARVGQRAMVRTKTIDSAGLGFDARVSADDTVKFFAVNRSGGAVDLASTVYVASVL